MKKALQRVVIWGCLLLLAIPAFARDFTYTYEGQTLTYTVLNEATKTCGTKIGYSTAGNIVSGDLIIPAIAKDGDTEYSVISIAEVAFYECSDLTSVIIPNTVTSIGEYAFQSCTRLTSVTIPNSVTTIGKRAFTYCSSLPTITIPNSVTTIGYGAFGACSNLTSISIPSSVYNIGINVFGACESLKSINVDTDNKYYADIDGVLYNKSFTKLIQCPAGISSSVTIPNSVTSIEDYAFYKFHDLISITIPNSVTNIGEYAFYQCTGLESAIIGNSVTSIGNYAFEGCTGLIKSVYPSTISDPFSSGIRVKYPANSAIEVENGYVLDADKKSLYLVLTDPEGEFVIPNSVTAIGDNAFIGCDRLTSVTIPNSVISIGDYAFHDCSNITKFIFEDGIEPLSLGSTDGKSHIFTSRPLKTVHIGRKLIFDADASSPFEEKKSLEKVTFGNTVETLPYRYFRLCSNLRSIELPESLKSIEDEAFGYCSSLADINLPDGLISIGARAFYRCSGLSTIKIPYSVTTIGNQAFTGTGVKEVLTAAYSLPNNIGFKNDILITLLPVVDNRFTGISSNNLQSYKKVRACKDDMMYGLVKASDKMTFSNTGYQEADIALVALDQSSKVRCTDNKCVVLFNGKDITETVLSNDGFEFQPSLNPEENIFTVIGGTTGDRLTKDVTLKSPGTLFNEIGLNNIDKVEILSINGKINGTDVMTINRMPALRILDISGADIVEGGTTYREDLITKTDIVGTQFFYNTSLESIKLPQSAKEIADDAFADLKTLKTLRIGSNISKIGNGAFNGCQLLQHINIPASVNSIGSDAFSNCASLSTLNIEDGRTYLTLADLSFRTSPLKEVYWGRMLNYKSDKKPFEGCTTLYLVTIGDNITSIAESEFKGCLNLRTVSGGTKVSTVGEEAFMNCGSLENISISRQLTTIEASVFNGCSSLTDIYLPESITSIGSLAFSGTALTEIRIPEKVRFIGESAFSGCGELKSVYSYNLTPPEISSSTFDQQTEKSADLKVIGDAMVHYWLDPVWQEFSNLSGNLLYMKEIADMTYGDPEFDLSQYNVGSDDVAFMTTTPDLIRIDGSVAKISGAGTAEIVVIPASSSDSEKETYRRKFRIEKKNLILKSRDILIFEGQELRYPELVISEGLAYDDKAEDIEKMPSLTCKGGEYPVAGVYDLLITGGSDKNYNFNSTAGILIVAGPETTVEFRRPSPFYTSETIAMEGTIDIKLDEATLSNRQFSLRKDNLKLDSNVTFNCGDYTQDDVMNYTSEYLSPISYNCSWNIYESLKTKGDVDYRITFCPDSNREREYEFNGSVKAVADSDLYPANVLLESVEAYHGSYCVRNHCMREYLRAKYPVSGEYGNIIPVCFYFNSSIKYELGYQVLFMNDDNSSYYESVLRSVSLFGYPCYPDFYINRKEDTSLDFTGIVDLLKSKTAKRNFFRTGVEAITQDDSENGTVNIEFSVTPAASVNGHPVNVALILTQDNIHSTNSAYNMANYYEQFSYFNINIPEDMKPFAEWYSRFGRTIGASALTYNDVVRFILPAEETVASDWTAKVPVKGRFSFQLPDNPDYNEGTMDPENLNFILVATDAVSGECISSYIVNWGEYINGSCSLHVSLDKENLSLTEGQSEILTPVIEKDEDVEILSDSWFSSDSSVATVENGVVTAIAKGRATVGYKLTDNLGHEHVATCLLTVNEIVGLDYLTADENSETLIFTTEGLRIESGLKDLAPGIYIVRNGNSVRKIKVK